MSDREEFEKWYDEATNCNHGVAYYVGINDRYCFTDIEIAWQAWQAARAQGGQGAEPVAYRVLGPYTDVPFRDLKTATVYLNGLHATHPDGGYKIVPLYTQPTQQGSVPKGENDFGLDARYFHEKLSLILRDINSYTPTEMARALGRLAITANPETMREPEFNIGDLIDQPKYRDSTPTTPQADGWVSMKDQFPRTFEPKLGWNKTANARNKANTYRIFSPIAENVCDISHWMDLPQPPRQKGSGDE